MKNMLRILLPEKRNHLWLAISLCLAAGVVALIWDQRANAVLETRKPEPQTVEEAATYIPEGYVLVPIEVTNFDSLDSILGAFGVVDLYAAPIDSRERSVKIADDVKILRAPLNPNHFAVLVPENESQKIVAVSGEVTVVVQNPKKSGSKLVKADERPVRRRASRVIVEGPHAF